MGNIKKLIAVVIMGLAAVYGLSPIDVVPDPLVPVGFADDVGVIVAAFMVAKKLWSAPPNGDRSIGR